jgi:PAS domain S-box-containing protein
MRRTLRDPSAAVHTIADPAFVTDEDQRIVGWNLAAERLLGYSAAATLGRPCHEIVCGADLFGNALCDHDCTLSRMARRGEPIASFEMCVSNADGSKISVAVSVVVLPDRDPSRWLQVHIFRLINRDCETAELLRRSIGWAATTSDPPAGPPGAAQSALTNREMEILRHLAEGKRTADMADELCVSVSTVRTHVRNLLMKLEAHNRLEAVTTALRRRLI